MFDTNRGISEARHFMIAAGAALLFALACLTAALSPLNRSCSCAAYDMPVERPTLL